MSEKTIFVLFDTNRPKRYSIGLTDRLNPYFEFGADSKVSTSKYLLLIRNSTGLYEKFIELTAKYKISDDVYESGDPSVFLKSMETILENPFFSASKQTLRVNTEAQRTISQPKYNIIAEPPKPTPVSVPKPEIIEHNSKIEAELEPDFDFIVVEDIQELKKPEPEPSKPDLPASKTEVPTSEPIPALVSELTSELTKNQKNELPAQEVSEPEPVKKSDASAENQEPIQSNPKTTTETMQPAIADPKIYKPKGIFNWF